MATLDDILITVWTTTPRLEQVTQLRRCLDYIVGIFGRGSGVTIALTTLGLPPKPVRDGMAQLARDYADRTIATAVVLGGDGFWASALRGLATSFHQLGSSRSRYKQHVCGSSKEAATWLAPLHSAAATRPVSASELEAAFTSLSDRALASRPSLTSRRPVQR